MNAPSGSSSNLATANGNSRSRSPGSTWAASTSTTALALDTVKANQNYPRGSQPLTSPDVSDENWDTAQEGEDGAEDDRPMVTPEERARSRKLKGKDMEVYATEVQEEKTSSGRAVSPMPNGHSALQPGGVTPSSSPSSSGAFMSPSPAHVPPGPGPGPRPPTASRATLAPPETTLPNGSGEHIVPSVNVIPNSPPPPQRNNDQRGATGSLDISHPVHAASMSQENLRRRETVNVVSSAERANRRRSFDPRAGANRLSGFFTNFLTRRDRVEGVNEIAQHQPSTSRPLASPAPVTHRQRRMSLPPDVTPPPAKRPVTPPPSLPPPTLRELGLEMIAITPIITASQMSSPPVSGVFLAPHYLLLCHNQGLDVLPLTSPPARMPYALIRRVAFKSVIIMEARGVLVAIAGRREGVRVYALDEVRKAVEWRVQVEVEREREKEERHASGSQHKKSFSMERPSLSELYSSVAPSHRRTDSRSRISSPPIVSRSSPSTPRPEVPPLAPQPPLQRRRSLPISPPPTYSSLEISSPDKTPTQDEANGSSPSASNPAPAQSSSLRSRSSFEASMSSLSVVEDRPGRLRNGSVSTIAPPNATPHAVNPMADDDEIREQEKPQNEGRASPTPRRKDKDKDHDWMERHDSDDEALDPVAAGPSASAALDERTSAIAASASTPEPDGDMASPTIGSPVLQEGSGSIRRAGRPANLELPPPTLGQPNVAITSSPAPTLMSLRQALSYNGPIRPGFAPRSPRASTSLSLSGGDDPGNHSGPETPHEVGQDYVSLSQIMAESRITAPPFNATSTSNPPPVSRPPVSASAVLASLSSNVIGGSSSPHPNGILHPNNPSSTSLAHPGPSRPPSAKSISKSEAKKRRRFSLINGPFSKSSAPPVPATADPERTFPASLIPGLPAASLSSPNLNEPYSGLPRSGYALPQGSTHLIPPPTAASQIADMGRSMSQPVTPANPGGLRSSSSQPLQTVDRVFQTPANGTDTPPSPTKIPHSPQSAPISRSSTSGSLSSGHTPTSERRASRFLPKLFTGFSKKHAEERRTKENSRAKSEVEKRLAAGGAASAVAAIASRTGDLADPMPPPEAAAGPSVVNQSLAPKLEYVKLPGTKGAMAIKAVETQKKSFLAILCGDNGEKIELFAGTYRTALGLSRTFILPDSPRSLELQLQGDDLVEVFLVFAQNVFGLEPATVRVREVRIGRAERRAARRRARDLARSQATSDPTATPPQVDEPEGEETVITTVVTAGEPREEQDEPERTRLSGDGPTFTEVTGLTGLHPPAHGDTTSGDAAPTTTTGHATVRGPSPDEMAAMAAAAQLGPYTSFQQLSFAPAFPLGTIADDYIIPPTYRDFIAYRSVHEPENVPVQELLAASEAPAILGPANPAPPPPPPPSKWYYIDPKGVVQGPWKTSLMQSWFNDGFLPPDLPVRRDSEIDYRLLKDICATASNKDRPFDSPPEQEPEVSAGVPKVLLPPISLLAQPRRFGPPPWFYSSRGGHSTTIVDSKGRSVLRGRFDWTAETEHTKLGDVMRLEAFDTRNRAVLVALRQGGVEAVDVGHAMCSPGDDSRSFVPHFRPDLPSIGRRPTFLWKLGSPIGAASPHGFETSISSSGHSAPRRPNSSSKKSIGASPYRASGKADGPTFDDLDGPIEEELLFLGRHNDTIYFCERGLTSFRIISIGTIVV